MRTAAILALSTVIVLSWAIWGQTTVQASPDNLPVAPEAMAPQSDPEPGDDPDPNLGYLFGVYIVTWAGFFGYAFMMSRRQREMQREIDDLRAIIEGRQEQE